MKPLKWRALLEDCAFYFDEPTIKQETKMRKTLQLKYDDLFTASWRPALQSRGDLVEWACLRQNAWIEEKGAEGQMDCSNVQGLIDEFGPDYSSVRAKLGFVKGLF